MFYSKIEFHKKIKDFLLYLSAFVPMYILIFIKLIIELICKNINFTILSIIYIISLLLLITLGTIGLIINTNPENEIAKNIIILKKENITDRHFLGYFSLFVLFALQLNLNLVSSFISYILIIFFIGYVYIKNSLFYINPFLNILGFSFYDIEYIEEGSEEKKQAKFFYKGLLK